MKIKAKCVSAQLRLSPKKEDEVTQYAFLQSAAVLGLPGDLCFEGAIRIHIGLADKQQYQVGQEYELDLEVKKCST
jgi:hypothetical protein